jgi:uncharacterized membrane protein
MRGSAWARTQWNRLRSTYWFVPAVMTVTFIGLAFALVQIDRAVGTDAEWIVWAYGGGADGARSLLSAVATSTITVISLTFSVTIVALTVSSQHFGPRLLNNFMRDTSAQLVLGMFIGTFAFCLIVLRSVRGEGDGYEPFVPHLAVTADVVLALLSVATLIYYIHHVSISMQVSQIALTVSRDLERSIDRLYPAEAGTEPEEAPAVPAIPAGAAAVTADVAGYVQAIDLEGLLGLAAEQRCTIWLRARPGEFVCEGTPLASAWPEPSDRRGFESALRATCATGPDRTSQQDAEFPIQQLVEVALHALSPGINEPFTAITCIDRLGQGLARLVARPMPAAVRTDETGQGRLVAEPRRFPQFLSAAVEPIALFAGENPDIYLRLLDVLRTLAQRAHRPGDTAAILEAAAWIRERALTRIEDVQHRRRLDAAWRGVGGVAGPRPTG